MGSAADLVELKIAYLDRQTVLDHIQRRPSDSLTDGEHRLELRRIRIRKNPEPILILDLIERLEPNETYADGTFGC